MDSRSTPQGICGGHAGDQSLDVGVDAWATSERPARELRPIVTEATALPAQDGIRGHHDEGVLPASPDPRQADPQKAISSAQSRPDHCSLVDGELVALGQVLKGKLAVAGEHEGEESKQVEQESDHRARSSPD